MKKHLAGPRRASASGARHYRRIDPALPHCIMQTAAAYEVRRRSDRAAAATEDEQALLVRRQARIAALLQSSGIWAGEPRTPRDGMVYQKAMRAEWR